MRLVGSGGDTNGGFCIDWVTAATATVFNYLTIKFKSLIQLTV